MNVTRFKQLILPSYDRMYALAVRMLGGDTALGADLVQDTIAHLWANRDSINYEGSVEALCLTAVRNRCISHLRSGRPAASIDEAVSLAADSAPPDADCSHLHKALGALDERKRRVMLMSMRGFTFAEIALEMHLTEANVRQLLCRARKQVKDALSQLD